jgi:hypothetical protein
MNRHSSGGVSREKPLGFVGQLNDAPTGPKSRVYTPLPLIVNGCELYAQSPASTGRDPGDVLAFMDFL